MDIFSNKPRLEQLLWEVQRAWRVDVSVGVHCWYTMFTPMGRRQSPTPGGAQMDEDPPSISGGECWQCVQKASFMALIPQTFKSWRLLTYWDWLIFSSLFSYTINPSCLVQLYAILPSLCSAVVNEHVEVLGAESSASESWICPVPAFLCLCVCPFFLPWWTGSSPSETETHNKYYTNKCQRRMLVFALRLYFSCGWIDCPESCIQ